MRIRRLAVTAFRCIDRAHVELGRGLNVLYGPNDLGKSTLALALRAVLLLPPGSSEAETFRSWYDSRPPSIELVFEDDDGKVWRVSKTFGSGSSAKLDFSKDGAVFSSDCSGRQVDERLRKLLGWGIPPPGGKGGPKGLPESFLSQVLLAEQTDVVAVLESTLEDDPDESGRLRLTKALKGLAQHPLFKSVLDRVQAEHDRYFTAMGRKKSGKTSPFAEAAEATRSFIERLAEKQRQLQASQSAEAAVLQSREWLIELRQGLEKATAALRATEDAQERRRRLEVAKQAASEARLDVERIQAENGRVDAKMAEVAALRAAVAEHEKSIAAATSKQSEAAETLRGAEEAHRRATTEDAARERELEKAKLEKERAELASRAQQSTERRDRARAALEAQRSLAEAQTLHRDAAARLEAARSSQSKELASRARDEELVKLADAVVAFGRWRGAADAAESARKRREEANTLREKGAKLEAGAAEARAAVAARPLPQDEELRSLVELQRKRDLAEAALGGGMSLSFRPRRSLSVRTRIDGVETARPPSSEPLDLEAESTIELSIEDLVDISVIAGHPASRREAERLRAEWREKAVPVLERAQVRTIAELEAGVSARRRLLAEADRSAQEAVSWRERAEEIAARAAELEISGRQARSYDEALAGHDRAALRLKFERLGSTDAAAEREQQERWRALEAASGRVAKAQAGVAGAEADLRNAVDALERASKERDEGLTPLGGEDASVFLASADRTLAEIEARMGVVDAALRVLSEQRDSSIADAERLLADAAARAKAAEAERIAAVERKNDASKALERADGELTILQETAANNDLLAAQETLKQREAETAAVLASGTLATPEDVAKEERALREASDRVRDAEDKLHQAEGALKHVGGAALRDEIAELSQARERAEARERDLGIQAEAWRLLRETLREAEDREGSHLGKALAEPVAERFAELTANRYGVLSLGPALTTQGVSIQGAAVDPDGVLAALSVGTKQQLATLLRLAIAEQLESAIVLDDHLVQTDPERFSRFRKTIRQIAMKTQVVILTCHPEDYVPKEDLPGDDGAAVRDLAAGTVRAIDLSRTIIRC